jgi:hypothetical protein
MPDQPFDTHKPQQPPIEIVKIYSLFLSKRRIKTKIKAIKNNKTPIE